MKQKSSNEGQRGVAVLVLFLACALWGLSFPLVKAVQMEQAARLTGGSGEFLACWLQSARFFGTSLVLLPIVIGMGWPTKLEWWQGLQIGLWGGTGMALQSWGLAHTEASTSAFLTQGYCVMVPLYVALKDRCCPEWRLVIGCFMVIMGVIILSGITWQSLRMGKGEAATLLATLAFSGQIICLDARKYRQNRGRMITLVMALSIGLAFGLASYFLAPDFSAMWRAGSSWPVWWMVAGLVFGCSVGPFLLMNSWQRRVGASEAGLIYTSESVFAMCYSIFLPAQLSILAGIEYSNEALSWSMLSGGGLILGANFLVQWRRKAHRPAIAPVP